MKPYITNRKLPILAATITTIFFCSMFSAQAEIVEDPDRPGFVKDSYIIKFKKPKKGEQPIVLPAKSKDKRGKVKFGKHSSGQDKEKLAKKLNLKGKIHRFLEAKNAIHVKMDKQEAKRWRKDERVEEVHQGRIIINAGLLNGGASTENTGWWALDRLDSPAPNSTSGCSFDSVYADEYITPYNPNWILGCLYGSDYDGTGRTIYIFDTGIADDIPAIKQQFITPNGENRLEKLDLTSTFGTPEHGLPPKDSNNNYIPAGRHGTGVAMLAAGKDYGTAKGAKVYSVKVGTHALTHSNLLPQNLIDQIDEFEQTEGPYQYIASDSNAETFAFQWLAEYGNPGDIVNWSRGIFDPTCLPPIGDAVSTIDTILEEAMIDARKQGILIVAAAHNDGCNTEGHTPVRLGRKDVVFVVGGTMRDGLEQNKDLLLNVAAGSAGWRRSRTGIDVSVYAPAYQIRSRNVEGEVSEGGAGTSLATALVSGLFATACQYLETTGQRLCDKKYYYDETVSCPTVPHHEFYKWIRNKTTKGTVFRTDNVPVPGYCGGPTQFLYKSW